MAAQEDEGACEADADGSEEPLEGRRLEVVEGGAGHDVEVVAWFFADFAEAVDLVG